MLGVPTAAAMSKRKLYYFYLRLKAVECTYKSKEASVREICIAKVQIKLYMHVATSHNYDLQERAACTDFIYVYMARDEAILHQCLIKARLK